MNYFDFGLQRSGTNFIEQIINMNFDGKRQNRNNSSWKHFIDPPEGWNAQHPTFLIYKNPYTWVESICFRNTVDWIKRQPKYPALEGPDNLRVGPKRINVENLAKTYKHWQDSWVLHPQKPDRYDENVFIIKYEDLLFEGKRNKILSQIQSRFQPQRKNNHWVVPQKGRVSQSRDYDNERESYYLDMKPEKLDQYHINIITNTIGRDVIQRLGYDIL